MSAAHLRRPRHRKSPDVPLCNDPTGRFAGMYYRSYFLPAFRTEWNTETFLLATVVPCLITLVLLHKLSFAPLQFLRCDFSHGGKSRRRGCLPLGFSPASGCVLFCKNARSMQ